MGDMWDRNLGCGLNIGPLNSKALEWGHLMGLVPGLEVRGGSPANHLL